MVYYSAIKMNKVMTHAATWMDPENCAELKKSDRKGHILFDPIYNVPNRQICRVRTRLLVIGDRRRRFGE